jgi:DNA polymerase III delta prime subunit
MSDTRHHAFVIEAGGEEGIKFAREWLARELGMKGENNPDISTFTYGLFSVGDARRVCESAVQAPIAGEYKAIVIGANRAYHEAQNALLKLFEEPPKNTYLFLILPSLGGLLPTLRSRVQIQGRKIEGREYKVSEEAEKFLKATKEKRSAIIKKLATGSDEEERRENRDEVIAIVNGVEAALATDVAKNAETLREVATLRGYLYDRSAPVRMILEHLSLVLPQRR